MITKRHWAVRALAAAVLSTTLISGFTACATDPRRKPPAIGGGVNADIGTTSPTKVRNLLVVTRDNESGFVSGALTGGVTDDQLTAISGIVIGPSGDPSGPPIEFTGGPTEVVPYELTQISVGAPFTGTGYLPAGQTMRMSLTFAKAGPLTLDVPIVDGNDAAYLDASPDPTKADSESADREAADRDVAEREKESEEENASDSDASPNSTPDRDSSSDAAETPGSGHSESSDEESPR